MSKISATIVGHGVNIETGMNIYTFELVFPRFILSEMNTHRAFSRNSASSRAIPFKKMVEVVDKNPFIPVAWQKEHKGMQGTEYHTDENLIRFYESEWIKAKDCAVAVAQTLSEKYVPEFDDEWYPCYDEERGAGVTKQLCNRLLEPFMWHKVIVTTTQPGLDNFIQQRCPLYEIEGWRFYSRAQAYDWFYIANRRENFILPNRFDDLGWLKLSKSGAEIHMQLLAEAVVEQVAVIGDYQETQRLAHGDWYYPYKNKVDQLALDAKIYDRDEKLKIAIAMCAHVSYTTVGEERRKTGTEWLEIYKKLASSKPLHASPMEHVAYAADDLNKQVRNLKDFVQWRTILELL